MANVTYIAPVKAESTIHKIRCAAYCRVSSNSEDQLHSYAAQVKFYSTKFDNSDTEVLVDIYADEGITGTSAEKRTEFQRLIKDCKRGKIDRIFAKSISRFARNTKDCLNTIRLLRELGISIVFEEDNIDTAEISDEFMITVMGSLAQEESISISQNLRWSVKKRMANGTYITPSVPYGYIMENGILKIDTNKSEVVKRIFELYLSGMGTLKIARKLEVEGIPTTYGNNKWTKNSVMYILTNERYIGRMLLQKSYSSDTLPIRKVMNKGERDQYLVTDSHEPIISEEDFNKVQELLMIKRRKFHKRVGNVSIFKSIIKCCNCNSSFKHKDNKGKEYLVCPQHDTSSELCLQRGIAVVKLEQTFIRLCNKLILHYREILLPYRHCLQDLYIRKFSNNAEVLNIHKDVANLKDQRHVISRLRKRGLIDEKKYNEKLAVIDSQLARLEREKNKLSKADNEDDALEQLDTLIDCIEKHIGIMTEFDAELFSMIVERVVVRDDILEFDLISGLKFKERI